MVSGLPGAAGVSLACARGVKARDGESTRRGAKQSDPAFELESDDLPRR